LGGGKHTFVEVVLRSGMVHETHCKFRGPWRRSGGGSLGFFLLSAGGMVEGDLGPLGRRDSRGGGCFFLWRRAVVK